MHAIVAVIAHSADGYQHPMTSSPVADAAHDEGAEDHGTSF
jgi:hypothetical protein